MIINLCQLLLYYLANKATCHNNCLQICGMINFYIMGLSPPLVPVEVDKFPISPIFYKSWESPAVKLTSLHLAERVYELQN